MTRENHTVATITQKDFYSRYDGFSGMTGTSSKRVFSEVFNKENDLLTKKESKQDYIAQKDFYSHPNYYIKYPAKVRG